MRDTILELTMDAELNIYNSYDCPFCDKPGRKILSIKKTSDRVIAKCFSTNCPVHERQTFYLDGGINPEAVKRMLLNKKETHKNRNRMYQLPETFTFDIPQRFKDYLAKYHIGQKLMDKYHFGYVQEHRYNNRVIFEDRLILPTPSGYVARSLGKEPKWMNFTDYDMVSLKGGSSEPDSLTETGGKSLVLVEDPLSMIRVGEVLPALSLFGTKLKEKQFLQCMKYKEVIIYLDSDIAGRTGAMKVKKQLDPYVKNRIVFTELDPKCLNEYELKEVLNE